MSQLDSYIRRFGQVAGPKLYHAIRSRSAYMGANCPAPGHDLPTDRLGQPDSTGRRR